MAQQPYFAGGSLVDMPATNNANSAAASVTLTVPSNLMTNDIVVVRIGVHNASVTITNTTSGGQTWTAGTNTNATAVSYRSFWCRFNGTAFSASPVFGWTTSAGYVAELIIVKAVDTTTALDVSEFITTYTNSSALSIAANSLTTVTAGCLLLGTFIHGVNATFSALTSGWRNPKAQTGWRNAATSSTIALSSVFQLQSSAGGNVVVNETASSASTGIKSLLAFRPAANEGTTLYSSVDDVAMPTVNNGTTTISGKSARPKFGIVQGVEATGAAGTASKWSGSIGLFADNQNTQIYWGANDNQGFSNVVGVQYPLIASAWTPSNPDGDTSTNLPAGTVNNTHVGKATLTPNSSGYVLTASEAFSSAWRFASQIFGGDDIAWSEIAQITTPSAGTGIVNHSPIFINGEADLHIIIACHINQNNYPALNGSTDTNEAVGPIVGMFDQDGCQAVVAALRESEADGTVKGVCVTRTDACYWQSHNAADGTIQKMGAFSSITAGSHGFAINYTTIDTVEAFDNVAIVLGVKFRNTAKAHVGFWDSGTSTGAVSVTKAGNGTTSLETPVGVVLFSGLSGTATTARTADEEFTRGMSDGTNQRSFWDWWLAAGGSAGSALSSTRSVGNSTHGFVDYSQSTTPALNAYADIGSFSSGFSATYGAAEATSQRTVFFQVGPAPAASGPTTDQMSPAFLQGGGTVPFPVRRLLPVGPRGAR